MPNYGKFLKELMGIKNKLEEIFAAFLNEVCSAIVPNKLPPKLGDLGIFLIPCTLENSITCDTLADLGASINLRPYSLYSKLSVDTLKPTRICCEYARPSWAIRQVDFVIPEMEEDSRVHLTLGRPFLHTVDAVIRVKGKELNLGVRDERITFLINKAMQHFHSNDDTCFNIDVIDEVTEAKFDALLNDSEPFMSTSEKINETAFDREFAKLIEVGVEEFPKEEEEFDDNSRN
ncbi:hypothetical protein Tco_0733791 [Tanacetum coccineum]